jgi:hypothetical protein
MEVGVPEAGRSPRSGRIVVAEDEAEYWERCRDGEEV